MNYESIKALSRNMRGTGITVNDLLALAYQNDPFYADLPCRRCDAEWFAEMWRKHINARGAHIRRIHYILVSSPHLLPGGAAAYENTEACWHRLSAASRDARYLDLIPFDALVDMRNDEPMFFAFNPELDPKEQRSVWAEVSADAIDFSSLELPSTPSIGIGGLGERAARQDYVVEVWIEKSTQNDWLMPLCQRRGVNLAVGIGEQSETRSRELALRAAKYAVPVRVLYLSDLDPGGRSMPMAVARKVEFTIRKFGLDVDFQLIPVGLTPEQCDEYDLPRTPIKESERRKDKFEETFGHGATELDALEALHPGAMGRILEAEIDNFLDPTLRRRVTAAFNEQSGPIVKIEAEIEAKYADEIEAIESDLSSIDDQLQEVAGRAQELWDKMEEELEENCPDLSEVEIPRSEASGETNKFVLFDSKRDYLAQMDAYNAWRNGDLIAVSEVQTEPDEPAEE